jgi:hypothetical protein
MNKQSGWVLALVVVLITVNIALIATLWLKKDHNPVYPPRDAKNYLVESLSLTTDQVNSFDSLRKEHFERMKGYQDEMRHLKDNLFSRLNQPNANPDSLSQKIGELQGRIDLETFDHFSKLRSILNEGQKNKFDNIIQDVIRTMGPRGGPPPPEGPPH